MYYGLLGRPPGMKAEPSMQIPGAIIGSEEEARLFEGWFLEDGKRHWRIPYYGPGRGPCGQPRPGRDPMAIGAPPRAARAAQTAETASAPLVGVAVVGVAGVVALSGGHGAHL